MRKKPDPARALWKHDRGLAGEAGLLCGVDEVGIGPLAGGVVAACVVLELSEKPIPWLNDSKQLTAAERETLFPVIRERALAWGVGEATPEEIDRMNILNASFLAMRRALAALKVVPALVLVDGNKRIPEVDWPQRPLVGGDGLSASIAAASVLAKVTRDRAMEEWGKKFPVYDFGRHKGYGTADHRKALREHGMCPIHRRSFCTSVLERGESLFEP